MHGSLHFRLFSRIANTKMHGTWHGCIAECFCFRVIALIEFQDVIVSSDPSLKVHLQKMSVSSICQRGYLFAKVHFSWSVQQFSLSIRKVVLSDTNYGPLWSFMHGRLCFRLFSRIANTKMHGTWHGCIAEDFCFRVIAIR